MKTQTAVEWLVKELEEHIFSSEDGILIGLDIFYKKVLQAKQMEQEQIKKASGDFWLD
ncbi:hypothetical protein UFOVP636_24 [uncultured Caudovirales phage]|jgi:hypothetical protein|uniref:Uncharacterized protein n=1 Tax=uncultured Caudovirales phage TaxID=2100421 RepID=A0A6J5N9F6_9CAUD|nr:hypothetical protein UFOVP636_24 [uncultured Caudovirales phage]